MDGGGGGEGRAVEVEGERGEGRAVAGEGRRAACNPCDRYAPVVDAACEVRGGVLAACLVWEVVTCAESIERREPVDVGSRERMAREGSREMMLPTRNNVTPRTACNALGDSSRWCARHLCLRYSDKSNRKTERDRTHWWCPDQQRSSSGSGSCSFCFRLVSSTISTHARVAPRPGTGIELAPPWPPALDGVRVRTQGLDRGPRAAPHCCSCPPIESLDTVARSCPGSGLYRLRAVRSRGRRVRSSASRGH